MVPLFSNQNVRSCEVDVFRVSLAVGLRASYSYCHLRNEYFCVQALVNLPVNFDVSHGTDVFFFFQEEVQRHSVSTFSSPSPPPLQENDSIAICLAYPVEHRLLSSTCFTVSPQKYHSSKQAITCFEGGLNSFHQSFCTRDLFCF